MGVAWGDASLWLVLDPLRELEKAQKQLREGIGGEMLEGGSRSSKRCYQERAVGCVCHVVHPPLVMMAVVEITQGCHFICIGFFPLDISCLHHLPVSELPGLRVKELPCSGLVSNLEVQLLKETLLAGVPPGFSPIRRMQEAGPVHVGCGRAGLLYSEWLWVAR